MSLSERPRRLTAILAAVALLATGLFAAGATWYGGWSAEHLPSAARGLGEVWMERAARAEAAGALPEAREFYGQALACPLRGTQDRVHCQKRLGIVLHQLGHPAEALPLDVLRVRE